MMNILSKHKLVVAAAAIIIAGALWYGFSGSSTPAAVLGTASSSDAVNPEDEDIIATLLQLRSVTLSGTIFSSSAFQGLKDFSTDITPEPVGRPDPFAPLPAQQTSQSVPASGTNRSGGAGLFIRTRQ